MGVSKDSRPGSSPKFPTDKATEALVSLLARWPYSVSAKNVWINEMDTLQHPAQDTQPIFVGLKGTAMGGHSQHLTFGEEQSNSWLPLSLLVGVVETASVMAVESRKLGPSLVLYCGEESLP